MVFSFRQSSTETSGRNMDRVLVERCPDKLPKIVAKVVGGDNNVTSSLKLVILDLASSEGYPGFTNQFSDVVETGILVES